MKHISLLTSFGFTMFVVFVRAAEVERVEKRKVEFDGLAAKKLHRRAVEQAIEKLKAQRRRADLIRQIIARRRQLYHDKIFREQQLTV